MEMLQSKDTTSLLQPPACSRTIGSPKGSDSKNEVSGVSAKYNGNVSSTQRRASIRVQTSNGQEREAES